MTRAALLLLALLAGCVSGPSPENLPPGATMHRATFTTIVLPPGATYTVPREF